MTSHAAVVARGMGTCVYLVVVTSKLMKSKNIYYFDKRLKRMIISLDDQLVIFILKIKELNQISGDFANYGLGCKLRTLKVRANAIILRY